MMDYPCCAAVSALARREEKEEGTSKARASVVSEPRNRSKGKGKKEEGSNEEGVLEYLGKRIRTT